MAIAYHGCPMWGNDVRMVARRIMRGVAWLVLAAAALVAAYGVAALAGTLIPANPGWDEPERGIRIYIEDNGVHTGIVLPKRAAGVTWDDLVQPGDIADPRYAAAEWLAFGWGDRNFYVNTPSWADLDPLIAIGALVGTDDTVLLVEHIGEPRRSEGVRSILLRPEEYRRLAAFIRATFDRDGPAVIRGYGPHDAFYPANGSYSGVVTCNEWVGRALRTAGVRMGAWTPLAASVMFWARQ
ncbi:TIGR02117 family protein [Sphingosinithalassobacter sp. CS137]|uniref:TIGR02117 family protein n=1 Tax=Sphingosinithalassobacter sp. CS137 TaxID=2762748 RepID=UPI0021D2A8E4|nr:TIGR02117 family protein [Sphingosinithalassobacter sp. CS137]